MARRALVLGSGTRSFLTVIRSLGRGGVSVHAASTSPSEPAFRSRYVRRATVLPAYREDDGAWAAAVHDLLNRTRFDLVLPCDDASAVPLYRHRADLEPLARLNLPSPAAFDTLFDKLKTTELARSLGIPVPAERVARDSRELAAIGRDMPLPLVLKPWMSYASGTAAGKHLVRKVATSDELEREGARLLAAGPIAVQEFVAGRGVGVELLARSGRDLLAFQHDRIHEPPGGGGSSYRESVPLNPDLLEAARALLTAVEYTGAAMVEFLVDRSSGRWVLVEVNARLWGSLPLAVAAGADFPLALFEMIVDGRSDFPRDYKIGVRARNWRADVGWHRARVATEGPTTALAGLPSGAARLVRAIATGNERSDTLTFDDPVPAAAEAAAMTRAAGRAAVRRLGRRLATSRLNRKRLRERVLRTQRPRSVLFVCKGNICRSPYAAEVAQRLLPVGWVVSSAGYYPESNRPSPSEAIAAAARAGVNLDAHRSRQLDAEIVRAADLILVFDDHDRRRLRADYPEAADRVHLLGAVGVDGELLIGDPWGGDAKIFDRTYREIAGRIREWADVWTAPSEAGA